MRGGPSDPQPLMLYDPFQWVLLLASYKIIGSLLDCDRAALGPEDSSGQGLGAICASSHTGFTGPPRDWSSFYR